ncbi:MAG: hypothetical protein GX750_09735 [Clostridia bacterium]|nr:hypothetical protein [Clostridia bacterium]
MTDLLFVFNCLRDDLRQGPFGECASPATIEALIQAFTTVGHRVWPINVQSPEHLLDYLTSIPEPSLAFVYAEGFLTSPETLWDGSGPSLLREILSHRGIPTTHSTAEVMQLCRHKHLTSTRLNDFGLPVPAFQVMTPREFLQSAFSLELDFPLFVKPDGGGASLGINEKSVVVDAGQLQRRMEELYRELGDLPLILETYLPGQEYTVGIIGNEVKYVLPPLAFSPETGIRHLDCKRNPPANSLNFLEAHDHRWQPLINLAFAAFDALKASDVIRIDLKEDAQGNLYIIDVNGTPSLGANASLVAMANHINISYLQLVSLILQNSYERHRVEPPVEILELTADACQKLTTYASLVA